MSQSERFAVLGKDGATVINIVAAEAGFAAKQGWIPAEGAQLNGRWDGSKFTAPPAPPPAPPPEKTTLKALAAELGVEPAQLEVTLKGAPK